MSQFPLPYHPSHSHLTPAIYSTVMSHILQREAECCFNLATPVVILTLHHWPGWVQLCLIIFFLNFLIFLIGFFEDQYFLRIFFNPSFQVFITILFQLPRYSTKTRVLWNFFCVWQQPPSTVNVSLTSFQSFGHINPLNLTSKFLCRTQICDFELERIM